MAKTLNFSDLQIRQLFGSEDAEVENLERFKEYFVKNRAYDNLISPLPLRILVGHKGVGKSALLRYAYESDIADQRLSVFLKPDDLSDLLKSAGTDDFNARIEAWKVGIKRKVAEKSVEFLTDGAIDEIDSEVVKSVGKKISSVILDVLKVVKPDIHAGAQTVIYENFLRNKNVTIYIDDIDRGWSSRPQDILNVSALLNALKDISGKDPNTQCKIAIRTDVYYLVRTSDQSTDKVEQDVIRLFWTNDEILKLMAYRISTYLSLPFNLNSVFNMSQNDISRNILCHVMDPKFQGRGKWSNERVHRVIMSLCRSRPRDLVKLLHGAARISANRRGNKISTQDFIDSFPNYSEERLQDLFNEFKSEVANIDKLILQFKPTKIQKTAAENYHYTTDQVIVKIKNVRQSVPVHFSSGRPVTDKSILTFLYKIDFVIAKFIRDGKAEWKYFDQGRFIAHEYADFGNSWEVHPAYRWALQPNDVQAVIDTIAIPD